MRFNLINYQTGWGKDWHQDKGRLYLDAHAPSKIVLKALDDGGIQIQAQIKDGGRAAAIPWLNGMPISYSDSKSIMLQSGDELHLEARLEGNNDQCWNGWEIKNAEMVLRSPLTVSFWRDAHLGDSLGMMIACENFARENHLLIHVRSTPLFEDIHQLFELNHVKLTPDAPEMIHVHPFGYDFEKLGWVAGIAKAICLATGGMAPQQMVMPPLRSKIKLADEDVILCQFDGRSGGVWPHGTIHDYLKRYQGEKLAVLGGPDTKPYLGDVIEYRLGKLPYLTNQLLACKRFVGTDSGIAHLACVLGLEIDLLPSPSVGRKLVQGIFSHYPKPPRIMEIKTISSQNRQDKRLLLVSTTNGWNLGDDLIRQGVMRLLNVGFLDPVIWLNRAQVNVPDPERMCGWTPLWKKLSNFGDPRTLVANAKALVVAGTPEWIDTIQPYYRMAAETGLPIYIIGVGGGQEGQVHHLKQSHQQSPICIATVRDEAARRAMEWAGVPAARFLDPAFHADSYEPTHENWVVFNPRLQCHQHREFYAKLYKYLRDFIDVITVHEQEEYTHACEIFDKPVFFHSDYRPYIQLYRSCSTYIGGRMHGAIPSMASGAKVHLICHERKHRECEWLKQRLTCPEALNLWEQESLEIAALEPVRTRFDQRKGIQADFEAHQSFCALQISKTSVPQ
jgi:hypothetical protein